MQDFNISPFALPNTPVNEVRFEDPRDIRRVVVTFADQAPQEASIWYLQKTWPAVMLEKTDPAADIFRHGWVQIDDLYNSKWAESKCDIKRISSNTLAFTFQGLAAESEQYADYNVLFRRTLGIKVQSGDTARVERIEVYTMSEAKESRLQVKLDCGQKTPAREILVSGYNAAVTHVKPVSGAKISGARIILDSSGEREFLVGIQHMQPSHYYANDEALITFVMDSETFTVSLESMDHEGPVWFADQGVYITFADDPASFDQYTLRHKDKKTTAQQVLEHREQSYGGARNGQPHPHPCAGVTGCKLAKHRYWIETNGDLVIHKSDVTRLPGKDTGRYKGDDDGRFMFGLEHWRISARYYDTPPVMAYNVRASHGDIDLCQKIFASPLDKAVDAPDLAGDDTIIMLVKFTFTNHGPKPALAQMAMSYANRSGRSINRMSARAGSADDNLVPIAPREILAITDTGTTDSTGLALMAVKGEWDGEKPFRCAFATSMAAAPQGESVVFSQNLAPGEKCELYLKVPHIDLNATEYGPLAALDFDRCYAAFAGFWRAECEKGAQVVTPEGYLNALHKSHLAHVAISDGRMPGNPDLVNTSVGTSTYGNYSNESVMIVEELDERNLVDDVRARLAVWTTYQSTVALKGRFTDQNGVFYGAGGFEMGSSYCQNHGWVLWYLSKHFLNTMDKAWFAGVAENIVKGADWVIRQRAETKKHLEYSRGWEYGWFPAGALEDVDDYCYWLTTNCLTWRGMEFAARALEAAGHPAAARIRADADDFGQCLHDGFEKSRQYAPLVKLKNGTWIPHYPSRLYRRGRDVGWIREVLESAVYLLISGLYDCNSKSAQWITDDTLDNRYMSKLYFYPVHQPDKNWFDYGGFSDQPNLLAGLMPHLDRDEPEVYIWMFFNAWVSCYREEINAMVEHPGPILGFSNSALVKTSDQANAIKWLRYMFVYFKDDLLHFGRALPREWFKDDQKISIEGMATPFGLAGVKYSSQAVSGKITARVSCGLRSQPGKMLIRFRHPENLPIKSAEVNKVPTSAFDPVKGDVDISGQSGIVDVVVSY